VTIISICSTLRLSGVPITKNTTKHFVFTRTTGRTLEESLTFFSTTQMNCVKNGKEELISLITMRAVRCKHFAVKVMVGKKRLTTLKIINKHHVQIRPIVNKAWTAMVIIQGKMTKF